MEKNLKSKAKILKLLESQDLNKGIEELLNLPLKGVINTLISLFYSNNQEIRWRAVTAAGEVVASLAQRDMEAARIIMRRFIWNLNEESGGIGWGAPEAMGEAMACHEGLAKEYSHILVSYLQKGCNFLEFELLQRGVIWGVGRVAQIRPYMVKDVSYYLPPYLESNDAIIRGLSAWALGFLKADHASSQLESLLGDTEEIELYLNRKLDFYCVRDLAKEALLSIDKQENSKHSRYDQLR
ncbi:MAG: HEAT repeat domain-containing protein [Thermodesulfobacteriota bacterium]|nr:HEAT repeat domain-containing protein [Thermodesulfobacteriota bacterium]